MKYLEDYSESNEISIDELKAIFVNEDVNTSVFDKMQDLDVEFSRAAEYADTFGSDTSKARKAYTKAMRDVIKAISLLKIK